MRFVPIVLATAVAIVAKVDAIDIHYYAKANRKCQGSFWRWTNVNPNVCCETLNGPGTDKDIIASFSVNAIPTNWNIKFATYRWGDYKCSTTPFHETQGSSGRDWMCAGQDDGTLQALLGGAKYWFVSKKGRSKIEGAATADNTTECVKPDTLVSEDGREYNITGLDLGTVQELDSTSDEERAIKFSYLMI